MYPMLIASSAFASADIYVEGDYAGKILEKKSILYLIL